MSLSSSADAFCLLLLLFHCQYFFSLLFNWKSRKIKINIYLQKGERHVRENKRDKLNETLETSEERK